VRASVAILIGLAALTGAAPLAAANATITIGRQDMAPVVRPGDRLGFATGAFRRREPQRGEMVVLRAPRGASGCADPGSPLVLRVIGVPGDRVRVGGGAVRRNGSVLAPLGRDPDYRRVFPVVPPGRYLVLGDNRPDACDAHRWTGEVFVARSALIGKVTSQVRGGFG
jgi:signal peptidase I